MSFCKFLILKRCLLDAAKHYEKTKHNWNFMYIAKIDLQLKGETQGSVGKKEILMEPRRIVLDDILRIESQPHFFEGLEVNLASTMTFWNILNTCHHVIHCSTLVIEHAI
jgi:hypothetical protein